MSKPQPTLKERIRAIACQRADGPPIEIDEEWVAEHLARAPHLTDERWEQVSRLIATTPAPPLKSQISPRERRLA